MIMIKPYSIGLKVLVATTDLEQACRVYDELVEFAESRGLLIEEGHVYEMKRDEVINGSPLDNTLKALAS